MKLRAALLRAGCLLALVSLAVTDSAVEPVTSSGSCGEPVDDTEDEVNDQNVQVCQEHEALQQQKFMLLQSSMQISAGGESRQDDVYHFIQQLMNERAATEALRMADQAVAESQSTQLGDSRETGLVVQSGDRHFLVNGTTAAEMSGVTQNGEGDLLIFFNALLTNGIIIAACLLIFSFGRLISPMVYSFRDVDGMSDGFFGWIRASYRLTLDDIQAAAGLDNAMLIEFAHLAMKLSLVLGIPFLLILSPLDWFFGGNAAGKDHLSWIGMANVQNGSWVCWVHAPAVWWTVGAMQYLVFRATSKVFLLRRTKWQMSQPRLVANTVVVAKIPEGKNTVEGLTSYFDDFVFGRKVVRDVQIVKDTSHILPLICEREKLITRLQSLKQDKNEAQFVERLREVEQELGETTREALDDDSLNLTWAFVTFIHRREANISKKLLGPEHEEELEVENAPQIEDVLWDDLTKDPNLQPARTLIGSALIVALFFTFLPMVVGISAVTSLNQLSDWFPFVRRLVERNPGIATFWQSFVGALALSIVMGLVPGTLAFISQKFFVLRARSMVQNYLQVYFFYFSVVFVLLVTAIGSSLVATAERLLRSPMSVFALLAQSMPLSTHFYMNYFAVQWSTHFVNLTRYLMLLKFAFYSRIYPPLEAKAMAEPEDQSFYGIGARSAQWSLMLVIFVVFGTLSPLMCVLGLVNFVFCRVIYGYLVVFAETRKPDLGGRPFMTQLKQIQQGLFIYVALMTGVLLQKASSVVPGIISAVAFIPLYFSYYEWKKYRWEFLEFEDVKEYDRLLDKGLIPELTIANEGEPAAAKMMYVQPELMAVVAPPKEAPKSRFSGFGSKCL